MYYSNQTLEELIKELEFSNYDLAQQLKHKIDGAILDAIGELEKYKDEECDPVYSAVTAMEYLCSNDLKWDKVEYKESVVYYVHGFCEDTHYENHEISIRCNKSNRSYWKINIQCGNLGETDYTKNVSGNFKEAQNIALQMAKDALISGSYFILP